jgi:hypothetical protein
MALGPMLDQKNPHDREEQHGPQTHSHSLLREVRLSAGMSPKSHRAFGASSDQIADGRHSRAIGRVQVSTRDS